MRYCRGKTARMQWACLLLFLGVCALGFRIHFALRGHGYDSQGEAHGVLSQTCEHGKREGALYKRHTN